MKINRSLIAISVLALGSMMTVTTVHAEKDDGPDTMPIRKHTVRGVPHNGAGTGGAVVTGNGINYNGGPVMHSTNLYFILYGNWSSLDSTGPGILQTWAQHIAPSPYFNMNTTYGDSSGANVPNAVTFKGVYTDTGSLGTTLSDASIGTLTSNAINSGQLGTAGVADPNGLYMVLTAPGVGESSGFISSYCGWHWSGSFLNGAVQEGTIYSGTPVVQFGFIGNAAGPSLGRCAVQSNSPNGDAGADAMISVMAHELSEAVSDPEGNAWYASNGEENGDLCAWNFGTTYPAANSSVANVNLSGKDYLMQQIWVNGVVNGQNGGCALSYSSAPDFNVSVSGSQTVPRGTTSANYTATATPTGGFNNTVTWTLGNTPNILATPTSSLTGNTATFTLSPASTLAAGTYTVAVTGAGPGGTPTHSANATIVVTAPDFTVSVSGSQTIPAGGTTANYTLTAHAVNGFNGVVSWAFGSLPAGITASPNPPVPGLTSTFKLTAAAGTAPNTYTIPIAASSGTLNHPLNATLVISAPVQSFTLSIGPSTPAQPITRPNGSTTTVTYPITVTPVNGFTNPVTLSVSGGANGETPSITGTNPVTPGGTGTLSVLITNKARSGTKTLTVSGTATGTTKQTATTTITIK
jgi:hypothetical protein